MGTPGVEGAPRGKIRQICHLSTQTYLLGRYIRIRVRDGCEQRCRIRVPGSPEEGFLSCQLNDLSGIHHGNSVRDVLNNAEIMGDEDIGEIELRLEILQQVKDLRLNRYIKGRNRLVCDNQLRSESKRSGNTNSLPLAAAKGIRIALHVVYVQPDNVHQLHYSPLQFNS